MYSTVVVHLEEFLNVRHDLNNIFTVSHLFSLVQRRLRGDMILYKMLTTLGLLVRFS